MSLEIQNIHKSLGNNEVLKGVSLAIKESEFIALLGPSGSGKTTLLNILAGLEQPDRGSIILDGEEITNTRPQERRFGVVFQSYALFRHKTVGANIAFGMRVMPRGKRPRAKEQDQRVDELLDLIGLEALKNRFPSQLSGGQRQRVAMARALAIKPRLLLMDEPFSALDTQVRTELREQVRDIQRKANVSAIMVTHDKTEAEALANRIAMMENGRIVSFDEVRAS